MKFSISDPAKLDLANIIAYLIGLNRRAADKLSALFEEEITIENFHKVVKNSQPYIERTIVPKGAKVSFKSKLIVRFQYFVRKLFNRNR